jgi:C1A family cysteine protease
MAPVNNNFLNYQQSNNKNLGLYSSPIVLPDSNININSVYQTTPSSFDLRTTGKLTPVKNQLNAGTCWAHAVYGSYESYLLPEEEWDFSENNMKNLLSNYYPDGYDYTDGGNFFMATAYLARWSGPIIEADDRYNPNNHDSPTNLNPVTHLQEMTFIPDRTDFLDNENIKQAVITYGAVATSMYMDNDYYNPTNHSFYYNASESCNHAVCIVGWDDNYNKSNFTITPPENGAFIVKNSWGSDWGENGYFYVSYYDTMFGSGSAVFNSAEPTNNYNRNYQYDPLGWTNSLGYGNNTAWFSNIFTSQGNDTLKAVSFYAAQANSTYELYAYLNPNNGNPRSGMIIANKTGTITTSGYKTITFNSTLPLQPGAKFSIVIKLTTPGYNYPIPMENPIYGYSSKATAHNGESYISYNGTSWSDLTSIYSNSNVCLKAFTIDNITPTAQATPTGGLYNSDRVVSISMSESGSIYYTLDGSAPSVTSTLYTGPITISTDTVLKFIAQDLAGNLSPIYTQTYTFDRTAPTAQSTPAAGRYNTNQLISLFMSESGSIYYTLDGSAPSMASTLYTGPITISSDTVLKFIAQDLAGNISEIVFSQEYFIDKIAPNLWADPAGSYYNTTKTVHLHINEEGTIYYTLDGTNPTINSNRYTTPFNISSNTIIKYIGQDLAGNISNINTAEYIIDRTPPTATASPSGHWFNTQKTINITSNEPGKIYYTLDDSTPTETSKLYTAPFLITSNTTLKFIAQDLAGNFSPVYTEDYNYDNTPPTATASPSQGIYSQNQLVNITMSEPGNIYYTTNNENPINAGTKYEQPLILSSATVLKFIAQDRAGNISQVYTYYYEFDKAPPTVAVNIPGGSYKTDKTVNLIISEPGTIYYTLDGTIPNYISHIYSGPIIITLNTLLKYMAVDLIGNASQTYSQKYIIDKIAPTITPSLNGGTYNTNKNVYLTMNEPGNIYYTVNGQDPTVYGVKYTSPILITKTCVLKYYGIDLLENKSQVYTQTYTIDKTPPKVISTTPLNYTRTYSRTASIMIKFSESIFTSNSWNDIKVKDITTNRYVSFIRALSGNILTIKTSLRTANHWYQIILPSSSVRDRAGNKQQAEYSINFKCI